MPSGKDNEFSLSPEIARLSALLARDPNSKLFMPLAEEYIKAGMADEAVMTLEDGLKANPYYMSARVLLGKAYLEKGDLDSARAQFEQVVKTVPDNLFAHRKLGDIYKILGDRENSIRSYRMITLLSPKDEEAKRLLAELESGAPMAAPQTAPEPVVAEEETGAVATPAPVYVLQETPEPEPEQSPAQSSSPAFTLDEEPEVSEVAVLSATVTDEPKPVLAEAPLEEEESAVLEAAEAAVEAEEEGPVYAIEENAPVSDEGLDLPQQSTDAEEIAPRKSGYAFDLSQAAGLEDIFEACESVVSEEVQQSPEAVYEINDLSGTGISLGLSSDTADVAPAAPEEPRESAVLDAEFAPVAEAKEDREPFETETLAELYIAQGFYDRAITIYKNMLLLEPQNRSLKQKLEELYQLEKLRASMAPEPVEPETPPVEAEPEPLPVDVEAQDDGAGIVWEAEAELVPEAAISCDPAAVDRLERLLENIRRKGRR